MYKTRPGTLAPCEDRYCILEYRHDGLATKPCSRPPRPVLLVIEGSDGLRLLVAPDLASIVCEDDRSYIDELIADFVKRSAEVSSTLFQQLSSLSVGPLITHQLGVVGSDNRDLQKYFSHFIAL